MEYLNQLQTYQLLKDDYSMHLAGLYSFCATASPLRYIILD
jgi:hypothetical protein